MIYREAGQFKTTYASDQAIFPIPQDRVFVALVAAAALAVPLVASEYWLQAILIPFLIYALAALGLNLLTGYAGQLSLGTGGFMAVGAYSAFKLTTAFPHVNILVVFVASGLVRRPWASCSAFPASGSRASTSRWRRWPRSSSSSGSSTRSPWFVNYAAVGHHHRAAAHGARRDGHRPAGDARRRAT